MRLACQVIETNSYFNEDDQGVRVVMKTFWSDGSVRSVWWSLDQIYDMSGEVECAKASPPGMALQ